MRSGRQVYSKRLVAHGGKEVADGLRQILIEIASEAAKKGIWGQYCKVLPRLEVLSSSLLEDASWSRSAASTAARATGA